VESEALHFPPFEARVTTLANGLEILVREDRSAPVVSLQAWCRSGSIHEGSWLGAGVSHFLEHMLFKGAGGRDASEIAQAVQAQGGYINAYTSFDRTVYWIDAPAAGAMSCLDVLCDVVGDAAIPEDEFENEREVIRREIAMGEDNPDQVLSKLFFRTAYAVHPCRYPVIGHLDLFNQLRRDDLYEYYRERYSPDNLFLVVAGDVGTDEVVEKIGEKLGGLARRRRSPIILSAEPPQSGCRHETLSFPTELHRERLAWQVPDGYDPSVPAIDLLAGILGDGRSSRLFQSVREKLHLAHSIGAWAYTPSFTGQFVLSFDTEPEKADAAREAVLKEVAKLVDEGVSERELEKARRQVLSAQFSTFTDMRGQASDIGSNWLFARNPDHTRDYVEAVQRVTVEAVREVAEQWLRPDRLTSVALLPKAPSKAAGSAGAAKRSEDIRRIELANGLTVLLLEDHRVPFVQATGVFRGGLLAETEATAGLTRLMARLLTKDTRKRSAEELALEIESVGGGIGSSTGNNTFGVSVNALRPDLERVVDWLGETLLEPAFLPEVVEREKSFQIAQIKAEADRPFSVAMKALRRRLYGTHPYGLESTGTLASLGSMDRGTIEAMHRRLLTGGNGVVGVFGDLDPARAEAMIRSRFEHALAAGPREFTLPEFSLPGEFAGTLDLTHEKEQAVLLIGYRTVDLHHPDNPALEMIDEACSDMASRLFIRIREKLGLAYSVGATRMVGLEPGFLVFYVSTSPEKLDLVQEEMLSEVDLIVREGLEAEEFERAKASWLGREAIHLQGVRELASTAAVDELVGLGWDHYRKTPATVASLTRDRVREAAERHLREDNRVIVRLTK
jgi:zinc protease